MIPNKYKRLIFTLRVLIFSPLICLRIAWKHLFGRKDGPLRIVVLPQLTRVGDLVCSTPLFKAIKEKYPESQLAVITTNKVLGIIRNNPHIDQFIVYKSTDLKGLIRTIRRGKFDWSFSLSGSSFGNTVFFKGLVKHRVKITRRDRPRSERLTDWMNTTSVLYEHHTYLPGRYLDLLRYIDIHFPHKQAFIKGQVFITPESEKKAEEYWRENNLDKFAKVIGISISAGNKIKEWGDARFAELARELVSRRNNICIVFLGSKGDEERIKILIESLGEGPYIKATDFSLEELPSLMKRLDLYIAVDTGPIYVAYALDIPLVDITGPVDVREQPPHNERSICVSPPEPYEPSSFVLKAPGSKDQHKHSLERITTKMVIRAVEKLI